MKDQLYSLESSEFPNNAFVQINPSLYDGVRIVVNETKFHLFTLKNSEIGIDRFHTALRVSWPKWACYFQIKSRIPPITVVETDWGLGGGSLGPFIIAVHFKREYDEDSCKYLESVLGWSARSTGLAYIKEHFSSFDDPLQAYVTDQIIHELGHIFFLHGVTDLKSEVDTWFCLGLGIVYDRLIWNEISEVPSPVFESFNRVWKTNFANKVEIDQRLINPNTDRDQEFGLVRLQTYAHAKAGAYLSELRAQIGSDKFDDYVRSYLSRPVGSHITYDDFLSKFSKNDLIITRQLEAKFLVR